MPFIQGTINKLEGLIKTRNLIMVYRSQHFQEQTEIYRAKKAELQDPESDDDAVPIFSKYTGGHLYSYSKFSAKYFY